jgi:hypothetical protein
MNWTNFLTYGDSYQEAFETLGTQLFERFLKRTYGDDLIKFRVVNGVGGDGGVEAYGQLKSGGIIGFQAKWFADVIKDNQIGQIRDSVDTARSVRGNIKDYYICVPRAINSLKFGRGAKGKSKKLIVNTEDKLIDKFTEEMEAKYTDLTIQWWFEQDIELQIHEPDNEGVHKFWFEKEVISLKYLIQQFDLQKASWLYKKYVPELHGQGVIQKEVQQLLFNQNFRETLHKKFNHQLSPFDKGIDLIAKYIRPLQPTDPIRSKLEAISADITSNLGAAALISQSILEAAPYAGITRFLKINIDRYLLDEIGFNNPSNLQLGVKDRLIDTLIQIDKIDLDALYDEVKLESEQTSRLFLGNPGTGKTHALSYTVDNHLNQSNSPAIIIRAKGTVCSDWSQIFKKSLELEGWDKNQVLSGLEATAIRNDIQEAKKLAPSEEFKHEPSKVVICIDGLEEDTLHWTDWYHRLRESMTLMVDYPRVRFIYSARKYFLSETELPDHPGFNVTYLPEEGDVPVLQVIDKYFASAHYNIQVHPKSLIRGIDSLYALRLFCELYHDQTLTEKNEIVTAEKQLLMEKVNRINAEFAGSLQAVKGSTRNPVKESLLILSEVFYSQTEIEHNELFQKLNAEIGTYLNKEEIDRLIDYLSNHGFIIKTELPGGSGILEKTKHVYTLAYQSIMELVMAEKYSNAIISGQLNKIPVHLLTTSENGEQKSTMPRETHLLNQRIIQNIANTLFHDHGKLIGIDNYLSEGIDAGLVSELQLNALIKAPSEIAGKYKGRIDELFFKDYKSRHFVFQELIYPSASSAANYFGAEYLHSLLFDQPSAFERDHNWLGGDRYGINEKNIPVADRFYKYDLQNIIDPYPDEPLYLSEFDMHNEHPLIYAWALATLNQPLRERLRGALTIWALNQPSEYLALLNKIFACNDPQIQEDLASITLGIASKLKDNDAVKFLAEWALKNVFGDLRYHRNVIVRQGFRSIVEKAVQFGVINDDEANIARPRKLEPLQLLPLDISAVKNARKEIYPIVHDLAWYVINRSFDGFADYKFVNEDGEDSEDNDALKEFITGYVKAGAVSSDTIETHSWAMAAAISYMRSLGFSRTEGNGYTQATHGSKSKLFTLEEKYTWLAVHYIQGYLSDYLPMKDSDTFIRDYTEITDIPNPAEFIDTVSLIKEEDKRNNWVIQEELAAQIPEQADYDKSIRIAIEKEPEIDFEKWLRFKQSDFLTDGANEKLLALFNYTLLHDSKEYVHTSIDVRGVIIEKGQAPVLLDLILNHHNQSHFVAHIDRMVGSPLTTTYCNPTDIVWMNWINEQEFSEPYYTLDGDEKQMLYTVTSVTRNTVEGETEIYIASKFVRSILDITELNGGVFLDSQGRAIGIVHTINGDNHDQQEMVLVSEQEFFDGLGKQGLEIVWFIDVFSSKNALNAAIKSDNHPMKTRKYFVHLDGKKLVETKIWDARFSNTRD